MKPEFIRQVLNSVADGRISVEEGMEHLKDLPFKNLGYAKLDNHRELRTGYPEVIYGRSKTTKQLTGIMNALLEEGEERILVTKLKKEQGEALKRAFPYGKFEADSGLFLMGEPPKPAGGQILVICAGTSDLPVAEEAAITAEYFGSPVTRIYDAGVAGIHRLLAYEDEIRTADVIIVVAGMEGALLSVVGGLASCPVIGVPTSVGYGTAFKGLTPLFTMLNSCAAGTTVVNIDNGFGAGYFGVMIAQK